MLLILAATVGTQDLRLLLAYPQVNGLSRITPVNLSRVYLHQVFLPMENLVSPVDFSEMLRSCLVMTDTLDQLLWDVLPLVNGRQVHTHVHLFHARLVLGSHRMVLRVLPVEYSVMLRL